MTKVTVGCEWLHVRIATSFHQFPLASPYSGIVHHLSGTNICAQTQIFHHEGSWSVDSATPQTEIRSISYLRQFTLSFTFISRLGFHTLTLAHMLDSLVRVSRRVKSLYFANVPNGNKLKPASIHTPPHTHSKLSAHGAHGDTVPLISTL